ncbi:hypothetical protein K6U44_04085 [Vibrio parahaemolyticus]|uniref:hypothetical protein n=1 Tax=Vibrio parahaemolyticus TaxID=670 RepID=UPI001EEB4858|nr:hypothetical protein [Vibrio parahaemolyticus]MCG6459638.1 hypothetical protein [Vibrio parahaemolyticus]
MTKKRGLGLVQFRKNLDKINEMHQQGYPVMHIYNEISENIDIKKSQFYELFDREIKNKEVPQKKKTSVQPQRNAPSTKAVKTAPQQTVTKPTHSTTDEKPRDPYRRKTKPIHNPTMTPERRKELFG